MKTFRFVFFLAITLAMGVTLNSRINSIPPLGKFLSPFHGFWQNAEREGILYPEKLKLKGLSGEVTVYYDELRIPHIYARNETDLHLAQGYLTARDRLWQMDFFSRLVTGRLSEVVGRRALEYDRYNRRIGLKRMTEEFYQNARKDARLNAMLEAYSAGVNAYIDQLSYDEYPLEFKLLNYAPEKWSPMKSCLAYAMLSNSLSRGDADLENTNALMLFGRQMFDLLYPEQLGNLDPVIRQDKKWDFTPIPAAKPELSFPLQKTGQTADQPHPLNGSNNFVVAGSKTKHGHVLLANEPDLELTLPSIWYAYHLHSDRKNVMGVTIPGTPIILIGFNDSISWGVTNSPRDQVDWYSITFRDQQRDEYLYNNQWFKTEKVVEKFHISDSSAVYDTIIYVHHGPVVYDRNFLSENQKANYAMKWIAHFPSTTFTAMADLNLATSYREFVAAMRKFQGPPQNFVFGSAQGDIAMWLPGRFPVKWPDQGKFLMDGSDPRQEWEAYIPFDQQMNDLNPERAFLSSANQHQVTPDYPYWIYDHHFEYYRGRRINDRLRILNNLVPEDLVKLQNDNYNYQASESLPMMLQNLDTASLTPDEWNYLRTLSEWDFFDEASQKAPTIYQLWWDLLYRKTWDELDTASVALRKPNPYTTIHLLKQDTAFAMADILETSAKETPRELINITFKEMIDSLEQWTKTHGEDYSWFRFKNTTIGHLLQVKPFSVSGIRIGGYGGIVNAAGKDHGPSWRMVVELDPAGTKAWGVYPGSQTGNPGSPLYGHMIDNWASGDYYPLLFGQDIKNSGRVIFTQTLQPK